MRIFDMIFATVCIISAFYTFDLQSLNKCLSSALLLLMAFLTASKNEKLKTIVRRFAYGLVIFLIIKAVTIG
jgi:hypothetical protein